MRLRKNGKGIWENPQWIWLILHLRPHAQKTSALTLDQQVPSNNHSPPSSSDSMAWYGMVWYGMVWYGMVR